jgi:hypothetical protein
VLRAEILAGCALSAWTSAGSLPAPRASHAAFAVGRSLYVVGGATFPPGAAHAVGWRAQLPELSVWEPIADLPDPRYSAGALMVNDHPCVAGGLDGAGTVAGVHCLGAAIP